MALIFIILGVVLALLDTYVLMGVMPGARLWVKALFLLPSVVYLIVIGRLMAGDLRQWLLNLLFWLTLCVVVTTLLFCVFSLLGKGVALFWQPGFRVFNVLGLAVAAIWLGISLYGIVYGWKKVTVEEVTVASP